MLWTCGIPVLVALVWFGCTHGLLELVLGTFFALKLSVPSILLEGENMFHE